MHSCRVWGFFFVDVVDVAHEQDEGASPLFFLVLVLYFLPRMFLSAAGGRNCQRKCPERFVERMRWLEDEVVRLDPTFARLELWREHHRREERLAR